MRQNKPSINQKVRKELPTSIKKILWANMSKFAKLVTSTARVINPELTHLLNAIKPGFATIYTRNFSSSRGDDLVKYTKMISIDDNDVGVISKTLEDNIKTKSSFGATRIDLTKSQVLRTASYDVELKPEDRFGRILIGSKDDITVQYSDIGVTPSEEKNLGSLLKHKITIPGNSFGVLSIANNALFSIGATNPGQAFAVATSKLTKVSEYDRAEIEKMVSLSSITALPEDVARMIHIKIQERIFGDKYNEKFYKEVTSIVDKPTEHNKSSGTLMNFERRRFGVDNTTGSHYHPGERRLHIFTIGKDAGVTLNLCGINENPKERKDTEVHLDFPENSMSVLKFPAYAHHKFHGDFVCISVHPVEGQNILDAVQSGTLDKGFLESATVFSQTENGEHAMKELIERSHKKRSIKAKP